MKRYYYVNHTEQKAWSQSEPYVAKNTETAERITEVTFEEHAKYVQLQGYKETYYA